LVITDEQECERPTLGLRNSPAIAQRLRETCQIRVVLDCPARDSQQAIGFAQEVFPPALGPASQRGVTLAFEPLGLRRRTS